MVTFPDKSWLLDGSPYYPNFRWMSARWFRAAVNSVLPLKSPFGMLKGLIQNNSYNRKIVMKKAEKFLKHRYLPVIVLAILSFVILSKVFVLNWNYNWFGNIRYNLMGDMFKEAVLSGTLYPRWLPDLAGGYGYPTFVFYQPAFFYLYLPFSLLMKDIYTATTIILWLLMFTGGLGAYALSRLYCNRRVSYFLATVFILTPYIYVNLYSRTDFSEYMAMLITPWPFYFLSRLKRDMAVKTVCLMAMGLSVTFALIVTSHPMVAPGFAITLLVYFIGLCLDSKTFPYHFCLQAVLAVFIGVLISSPYWFPVLQLKSKVDYQSALLGHYVAHEHLISFWDLFKAKWTDFMVSPLSKPDDPPDIAALVSLQLGAYHFLLATIGVISSIKLNERKWTAILIYCLYLVFIVMLTPLSAYLWEHLMLLKFLQFPFRLLSNVAIIHIICALGIFKALSLLRGHGQTVLLVIAVVLLTLLQSDQFFALQKDTRTKKNMTIRWQVLSYQLTLQAEDEFRPLTAKNSYYLPSRYQSRFNSFVMSFVTKEAIPIVVLQGNGKVAKAKGHSKHNIRYKFQSTGDSTLQVNQLYFPGWRVFLNGQEVPTKVIKENLSESGFIQIPVKSGKDQTVEAYYDGPPHWRIRVFFTLLLLFAAGFAFFRTSRSRLLGEKVEGQLG
jgi:hypothetical protein